LIPPCDACAARRRHVLVITPSHQCFSAAAGKIATRLTRRNMTVVLRQSHSGWSVSVRIFEQPKTCLTLGE
jgi:hypothetical protein